MRHNCLPFQGADRGFKSSGCKQKVACKTRTAQNAVHTAGSRMMEHGRGRSIRDFTFEWCWQSVRAQLLIAVPRLGAISNLLCELNRNISIFHLSKNIYAILCQANTSAQTFFYCMQPNLPTQLYQSPLIFPHYHAVIVTFDILLYLFQIISPFWKKQKKQRRKGMQIDGAHKYRHRSAQTAAKK